MHSHTRSEITNLTSEEYLDTFITWGQYLKCVRPRIAKVNLDDLKKCIVAGNSLVYKVGCWIIASGVRWENNMLAKNLLIHQSHLLDVINDSGGFHFVAWHAGELVNDPWFHDLPPLPDGGPPIENMI
jgi:hypothetical protein